MDGALADFTKTIELSPQLAESYANSGLTELEQRKEAAADQDLDTAVKLDSRLNQKDSNCNLAVQAQGERIMIPERLDEVPVDQQVRQTFGWHPVLFGLLSLGIAVEIAIVPSSNSQATIAILLTLVFLGFFLLFYEWNRRGNRLVLSRFPEGIAVYRKGQHDLTVDSQQIAEYSLRMGNTFNYLFMPAALIVGLVAALVKKGFTWEIAVFCAIVIISLSSLGYTRILCVHYLVPRKSPGNQEVIFRRGPIKSLYT